MIYFVNPGEIDIAGATVAGLSAKGGDSPIGYFGTGLKYSISSILRWGGSISIWSGLTEYVFTAESLEFRGKEFKQIFMRANGQKTPLGFTTEYGKNWAAWAVFRELYANALDEGGDVATEYDYSLNELVAEGRTVIAVECHTVEENYHIRDKIILPKEAPVLAQNSVGRILSGPSKTVYYRGVNVADGNTMYTYDIKQETKLTEDRTVDMFLYRVRLGSMVLRLDDEELIYNILTRDEGLEKDIYFMGYDGYSPQFMKVAQRIHRETPHKYHQIREFLKANDKSYNDIIEITAEGMKAKVLNRAIAMCHAIGEFPANFPPIGIADLGRETLGLYEPGKNRIWIDVKAFEKGTKNVMSTLYEELTHWHTGHDDCNYTMQTYLFDKIISLYEEHVIKEPI